MHSILLAAASPVFKSGIDDHIAAGISSPFCISLPNLDSEELEIIVHFIYAEDLILSKRFSSPDNLKVSFQCLINLNSMR